jgi:hypothetical protein
MNNLAKKIQNSSQNQINEQCDLFFNFDILKTENSLSIDVTSEETYSGSNLEESALNTSWADYYEMIKFLEDKNLRMLDIGSSYSKGSLLCAALGSSSISSVEIVKKRVDLSKEILNGLNLPNTLISNANALDISFENFDVFFVYQPVSQFLSKLLTKLSNYKNKILWVIESHGDLLHRVDIDSRFIEKKELLKLNSKRHLPHLYQYKISSTIKNMKIIEEENFYQSQYALIESKMKNFGSIKWITKLDNSFVDYLDKKQTFSINNRRINKNDSTDIILQWNPNLSIESLERTSSLTTYYNGKSQKILKHIVEPKGYLELSIDGIVNTSISSN